MCPVLLSSLLACHDAHHHIMIGSACHDCHLLACRGCHMHIIAPSHHHHGCMSYHRMYSPWLHVIPPWLHVIPSPWLHVKSPHHHHGCMSYHHQACINSSCTLDIAIHASKHTQYFICSLRDLPGHPTHRVEASSDEEPPPCLLAHVTHVC